MTACEISIREVVRAACSQLFGSGLQAVILTGSMARGEATIAVGDQGSSVRGDAEFLVILNDRTPIPVQAQLAMLKAQVRKGLDACRVRCEISVGCSHTAFLRNLWPHIFAYELRMCGKVILGDPGILSAIPDFSPSEIPLEDGWRLLSNRLIEALEGLCDPNASREYRTLKLYLDTATSLLLFAGEYTPTYRERSSRLEALAARRTSEGWPFPLSEFARAVRACTDAKLAGAICELPAADALDCALRLWRWELQSLTGISDSRMTASELMRIWMDRQALRSRLRGWVHVWRKCGWLRSAGDWPRWARLGLHASPRYCVYAAAAHLLANTPLLLADRWVASGDAERAWSWLPVLRGGSGTSATASWKRLITEMSWNYREFLTETRA